jgi:hypothetical protein
MGWSPFRPVGLTHTDSRAAGGYTLITPIGFDSVLLIDEAGQVVHRWQVPGFQPGYGYLLPNGNLLVRGQPPVEVKVGQPAGRADVLLELDWDSNEVWRWEHPTFHHDMNRLPNGNTLAIIWKILPEEIANQVQGGMTPEQMATLKENTEFFSFILQGMGVGGRPRLEGMLTDAIVEVNPAGEIIHEMDVWKHCDLEKDVLCTVDTSFEWTHVNAVEVCPDGDILISCQKLDQVLKCSWPEGKLKWRWGGLGKLSHQHDPNVTPEGNLLVFDNGTHHPLQGRSRVVEVDFETSEIVWQYQPSPTFSMLSLHIAGAERLANGNTLICEGESGRIFEATKDNDICWEWNSPFVLNFKGVKAVMFFRAHRYAADGPELAGRKPDAAAFKDFNKEWGLI